MDRPGEEKITTLSGCVFSEMKRPVDKDSEGVTILRSDLLFTKDMYAGIASVLETWRSYRGLQAEEFFELRGESTTDEDIINYIPAFLSLCVEPLWAALDLWRMALQENMKETDVAYVTTQEAVYANALFKVLKNRLDTAAQHQIQLASLPPGESTDEINKAIAELSTLFSYARQDLAFVTDKVLVRAAKELNKAATIKSIIPARYTEKYTTLRNAGELLREFISPNSEFTASQQLRAYYKPPSGEMSDEHSSAYDHATHVLRQITSELECLELCSMRLDYVELQMSFMYNQNYRKNQGAVALRTLWVGMANTKTTDAELAINKFCMDPLLIAMTQWLEYVEKTKGKKFPLDWVSFIPPISYPQRVKEYLANPVPQLSLEDQRARNPRFDTKRNADREKKTYNPNSGDQVASLKRVMKAIVKRATNATKPPPKSAARPAESDSESDTEGPSSSKRGKKGDSEPETKDTPGADAATNMVSDSEPESETEGSSEDKELKKKAKDEKKKNKKAAVKKPVAPKSDIERALEEARMNAPPPEKKDDTPISDASNVQPVTKAITLDISSIKDALQNLPRASTKPKPPVAIAAK
jgi:hypothetical protein